MEGGDVINQSEELYRAVFSDDVHLASSKNIEGAFRGAVLDNVTNALRGQAEFVQVDVGDCDCAQDGDLAVRLAAALGVAVGVLGTIVIVKTAPSVKSWWLEDAQPRVTATWRRIIRSKTNESRATVLTLVAQPEIEPSESSVDEAESA
jgi:hypothetical protein